VLHVQYVYTQVQRKKTLTEIKKPLWKVYEKTVDFCIWILSCKLNHQVIHVTWNNISVVWFQNTNLPKLWWHILLLLSSDYAHLVIAFQCLGTSCYCFPVIRHILLLLSSDYAHLVIAFQCLGTSCYCFPVIRHILLLLSSA